MPGRNREPFDGKSLLPIVSPSKLLCEKLSDRVDGHLALSNCRPGAKSNTLKENWWSAERPPVRDPLKNRGEQKDMSAPPSFQMGKQLLHLLPSSAAIAFYLLFDIHVP